MVKHITKYQVFLDSNALRDKDWIKTDLFAKLEGLRRENLADVKFYLPGIVEQEWLNHYKILAAQHQSNVQRFHRKLEEMGSKVKHPDTLDDQSFEQIAKGLLRKNRLYVIPTPYDRIDWPTLMSRAVEHVAPFEPDSDKGIKDAVLAHTVYDYAKRHSARRDQRIVVITHDERLQVYLQEVFSENELEVYSTLEDFASKLRLVVDELGANLLAKAKGAFYTHEDVTSLYKKEEVGARLRTMYDDLILQEGGVRARVAKLSQEKIKGTYPVPDGQTWTPTRSRFLITQTSFVGRKGARLQWLTKLTLKQAYTVSTTNKLGHTITSPLLVTHGVLFDIKWSTKIGHTQNLISRKITSISMIDEKVEVGQLLEGGTPIESHAELTLKQATELRAALDNLLGRGEKAPLPENSAILRLLGMNDIDNSNDITEQ